jgi:16S rRNA (cytosine967-C5)-methyltransferase
MLARAAAWLKPGGTLVYSVCSLEPEEGEEVAATATLKPVPIRSEELPPGLAPGGHLRILPGDFEAEGGADSFFIARFEREPE